METVFKHLQTHHFSFREGADHATFSPSKAPSPSQAPPHTCSRWPWNNIHRYNLHCEVLLSPAGRCSCSSWSWTCGCTSLQGNIWVFGGDNFPLREWCLGNQVDCGTNEERMFTIMIHRLSLCKYTLTAWKILLLTNLVMSAETISGIAFQWATGRL